MSKLAGDMSDQERSRKPAKVKEFLHRQSVRLKEAKFTCPFCKETLSGLKNFGAHLKLHCT